MIAIVLLAMNRSPEDGPPFKDPSELPKDMTLKIFPVFQGNCERCSDALTDSFCYLAGTYHWELGCAAAETILLTKSLSLRINIC
jgi:hypothetical protein